MKRVLGLVAVVALSSVLAPAASAGRARAVGRIVIPKIGLNVVFFNGQRTIDTDHGPSHYPWSGMPGHHRTVAIAGHRMTHTHPFQHLDELKKGDLVEIRYGRRPAFAQRACYRVTGSAVVSPSAAWVTRDLRRERLVLTTCTPPGFSTYRLVVDADRARCT